MPRKGENIYKRKDGRWEGRYIRSYDSEHKAKYAYVYGKTYSEVKRKLTEQRGNVQKVQPTKNKSSTYGELLDCWLHSMQLNTKESTQARYTHLIKTHIKPHLGAVQLSQLTTDVIEIFIEQQLTDGRLDNSGGLSPKTVTDILTIIKSTIEYARYKELPVICNLSKLSIKKKEKEMRVFTPSEQESLIGTLTNAMDHSKFGVLLSLYSIRHFKREKGEVIMAQPQPAKVSYFFGKGYSDLWNTIKESWSRNIHSAGDQFSLACEKGCFTMGGGMNLIAAISIFTFGSLITAFTTFAHIAVLFAFFAFIYMGFGLLWLIDRIYIMINKIKNACPNPDCQASFLIPTYECPGCGEKHTNLVPSKYGILKRTCLCGTKLPTTFLNGRGQLKAYCPECDTALSGDTASRQYAFPVIGGPSVGKTCFINMAIDQMMSDVAPARSWKMSFISDTEEKDHALAMNAYGASSKDFDDILNIMLINLEKMFGLKDKDTLKRNLAVVINKVDIPTLEEKIGETAAQQYLAENAKTCKSYMDARDAVCRNFLEEYGAGNFVRTAEAKFKTVRYFTCSALGHNHEGQPYEGKNVVDPVMWLLQQADSSIKAE